MKKIDRPLSALAQRLRQLRKLSGMTQREFAEHLQLERSTYAYYETGVTTPSIETLKRISKEHRVSIDFLLAEDQQAEDKVLPAFSGTLSMSDCSEEERLFLLLFRRVDANTKAKVLKEMS